ncbi:MAG TPA: hypothetical protein PK760_11100, partial [Flavobacteriales bacterium]|nr:hypothetical protein [Flavobacteriales bacterium]
MPLRPPVITGPTLGEAYIEITVANRYSVSVNEPKQPHHNNKDCGFRIFKESKRDRVNFCLWLRDTIPEPTQVRQFVVVRESNRKLRVELRAIRYLDGVDFKLTIDEQSISLTNPIPEEFLDCLIIHTGMSYSNIELHNIEVWATR